MAQTINERFMDFQIAQQIKWIRLQNRDAEEALSILNRVDAQLESALMRAGIGDAPYTMARLEALKAQVTNLISVVQDEAAVVMTKNMGAAAEASAHVEEGLFRRELPAGLDITTPNLGVLQQAATLRPFNGAVMSEWTQQLKASDLTRTWNSILDGITSGATTDDLIRGLLGTKALQYKDGVREVSRRGMEALVRTSINHATNQGRQMVWESNSDILKGVRWVSTLDTRTTPICQQRDGKVGPVVDDPNWAPPEGSDRLDPPFARPPAHPNCRSTTTAVTKSWKELGFNMDELPAGTRASMDGQVPANMTYFEWLAKQSPERQKDILGPTRFDLWHNKGIQPDRFINDKGEMLTIKEIKGLKPAVVAPPEAVKPKGPTRLSEFHANEGGLDWFSWKKDKQLRDYMQQLDPVDFGLKAWPAIGNLTSIVDTDIAGAIGRVAVQAGRGADKFTVERARFDLKKVLSEKTGLDGKPLGEAPAPIKIAEVVDLTDFETARATSNGFNQFGYLEYLDPKEFGLKAWPTAQQIMDAPKGAGATLLGDVRMIIINSAPGGKPKRYMTALNKRVEALMEPPKAVPIKRYGHDVPVLDAKQFMARENELGNFDTKLIEKRWREYQSGLAASKNGERLSLEQFGAMKRAEGVKDPFAIMDAWIEYEDSFAAKTVTAKGNGAAKPLAINKGASFLDLAPILKVRINSVEQAMPNWVLREIADVTSITIHARERAFYNHVTGEMLLAVNDSADIWVHEMFHALDFKYRFNGAAIGKRPPYPRDALDWNTDDPVLNRLAKAAGTEFKNRDGKGTSKLNSTDGDYWIGNWDENYEARKYDFDISVSSEYITMGAQRYVKAMLRGDQIFQQTRRHMQLQQPAMLELLDYIWNRFK